MDQRPVYSGQHGKEQKHQHESAGLAPLPACPTVRHNEPRLLLCTQWVALLLMSPELRVHHLCSEQ